METRQNVGKAVYELNVKQYCCAGLNFDYVYDKSPLIGIRPANPY